MDYIDIPVYIILFLITFLSIILGGEKHSSKFISIHCLYLYLTKEPWISVSITIHDYWWKAQIESILFSRSAMNVVHLSNNLSHWMSTYAVDLEKLPPSIMLVWYEFPDGTIMGPKVMCEKQLKTSRSLALFL